MPRDLFVNGEVLVRVRSSAFSPVGAVVRELGLCSDSIVLTPTFKHLDVPLDAWGGANGVAPEVQTMLAEFTITMNLIHYDAEVLRDCLQNSLGGRSAAAGVLTRAGTRLGGGVAIGAAGNMYINLSLSSPGAGVPWYFPAAFLTGNPAEYPIGVERSIVRATWRAIPYAGGAQGTADDPANIVGGVQLGAGGKILWDNTTTLVTP